MATTHAGSTERYRYEPVEVLPPGETLRETLDALNMSQAQLAVRAGLSTKHINQIIQGQAVLTHETAITLERVTGVPARFWNELESRYRDHLTRELEREKLSAHVEWLKRMPIAALRKLGRITADHTDEPRVLQQALNFFGVAGIEAWEEVWANPAASYLKSAAFTVDPGAMAAWLRLGEIEATGIRCEPFDRARLKSVLPQLRELTVLPPAEFEPRMRQLCADAGVAVVLVREIAGCRASGATRWLSPSKVVVQLSLRGKRNDKFWFAFFHELAHVLLHGKRSVFIEAEDIAKPGNGSSDEESEANRFAADLLIPPAYRSELIKLNPWNSRQVRAFADRLGVAPAIVAGRLQFELKDYRFGKELFEKYELVD
ncbi:HigA family addiction module antitoxin [Saccharothrix ecbatanensis]|nr:HigA family addiction module antitoxin [Saccharothrix ecbatanensis]